MALLADVATASGEVAGASSLSRKLTILADLLRRLEADEILITVGFVKAGPKRTP